MQYFGEPEGRVKIQMMSKNLQWYYTLKCLIRDLLSNVFVYPKFWLAISHSRGMRRELCNYVKLSRMHVINLFRTPDMWHMYYACEMTRKVNMMVHVHFTWSGSCMVLHWCKDMLLLSVVWQNLHPIRHNIKVYLSLIYTYMYHTNKKKKVMLTSYL